MTISPHLLLPEKSLDWTPTCTFLPTAAVLHTTLEGHFPCDLAAANLSSKAALFFHSTYNPVLPPSNCNPFLLSYVSLNVFFF